MDCAQLLAAVWEDAGLISPVKIPSYSPQFFLHDCDPVLMPIFTKYAREIDEAEARAADLVLYRFGKQFSHCAIVWPPGWPQILHAYKQAGRVTLDEGLGGHLERRERKFFRYRGWS